MYISHISVKAWELGFNSACSCAIREREVVHWRYHSYPSSELAPLAFLPESMPHQKFFHQYQMQLLFWFLAQNISNNFSSPFPPVFHLDETTTMSPISKLSPSLRPLLIIQHWIILGFSLTHSHLYVKKIFPNEVFYGLPGFDPHKVYGPQNLCFHAWSNLPTYVH